MALSSALWDWFVFVLSRQAVGWVVGFVMGDFMYTLAGWGAGMALSIIVS